jgi:nucleotide-binding universal stress UspA family protein
MTLPDIRSILVATDLSEASDLVLTAAGALAERAGAALHVLNAFDFQRLPYTDENIGYVSFAGRIYDTEKALAAQLARTVPAGARVASQEVVIHSAAKAIVDRVAEIGADLVIIGPHRRRALADPVLGSTAEYVIRSVSEPCLVVRRPLVLPLERLLAPVDLSEPARAALDVALGWAARFGAGTADVPGTDVAFLHVIPAAYTLLSPALEAEAVAPALAREVTTALERTGTAGALRVRSEVVQGEQPAEVIVRRAEAEAADLVVLATHGYGAIRRALIGSVAAHVVRTAPCSVLLVPPALWGGGADDATR